MMSDHFPSNPKVYQLDEISKVLDTIRAAGKTITLCHGVFDLLHPGHIQHFKVARKLADYLFVSVTSDRYVNKGPGRPLFSENVRAESLAALENVDFVIISDFPTAIELINSIQPNFYVKGSDYINATDDVTGMIVKEREVLESYGGQIYFTNEMTSSSSMLINKFFSPVDEGAQEWLRSFKITHGYEEVINALDRIKDLKVLLLGETIIDQYTYCSPLAKSSKDPILAFHQHETNLFPGGVLTIANNCSNWVLSTKVISFVGMHDKVLKSLEYKINSEINLEFIKTEDRSTILKHRYVELASNTRLFEYYDFSDLELPLAKAEELVDSISKEIKGFDLVLAADYGHGFFGRSVVSLIQNSASFLAVNTQANAGNRGYNTISKYTKANLITMNGGELQLELRNRNPDYLQIVPNMLTEKGASTAVVTLGGDGLLVFDNRGGYEKVPAFADKLVDVVGAGDAVFAISSLLAKVGAPLKVIGFLANLVAAHEVSQLGHQSSLTQSDLRKHAKSILG